MQYFHCTRTHYWTIGQTAGKKTSTIEAKKWTRVRPLLFCRNEYRSTRSYPRKKIAKVRYRNLWPIHGGGSTPLPPSTAPNPSSRTFLCPIFWIFFTHIIAFCTTPLPEKFWGYATDRNWNVGINVALWRECNLYFEKIKLCISYRVGSYRERKFLWSTNKYTYHLIEYFCIRSQEKVFVFH
jgi:hypothetical protein